ncbi:facilitated trehalose transporter Tret1-like [Vanessa atalanta]|uniref:facilitated trehalose transporter Tret1-like n=1 Tax=Vanessa atalanta TaxID=42275 RepID=UPI001FCCF8C3|nr:facilitated trehalose transporter Tret1-like [Vanessa atalanta]
MSIIFQVLSTSIISYVCLTMGILFTWPSSTLILFSSANTTLDRVMTETEVSLLGSLSSISGIFVIPFSGYILDTLGRKKACLLFYMAQLVSWIIITTCSKVEAILFAMFIFGFSSCMFLVVQIYVSEFCQESIRGSMTSGSIIFYGIGMLVSYLMGGLLEYRLMNYIGLSLTVLGFVLVSMMKESPLFLMKVGRQKEAAKSIAFYRSAKIDSQVVQDEMEQIKRILRPDFDETPAEEKKLNLEDASPTKMSKWQYLKKSKSTQKALLVCIMLYSSAIFQGLIVVQVYAGPLFEQALPTMSSTLSSVLLALISVVAGFIAAYFVDLIGRRRLMIDASMATGVCCMILGSQIQFNWGPSWLTAVLIYLYCATYTIGAGTVPFVIVAEVFMPEVKSLTSMLSTEWAFVCNFIVLFIFNPLVNSLGLGAVFYIFSACSILSGIYCHFYLPETKGLTVDVIQERFKRSRQ